MHKLSEPLKICVRVSVSFHLFLRQPKLSSEVRRDGPEYQPTRCSKPAKLFEAAARRFRKRRWISSMEAKASFLHAAAVRVLRSPPIPGSMQLAGANSSPKVLRAGPRLALFCSSSPHKLHML